MFFFLNNMRGHNISIMINPDINHIDIDVKRAIAHIITPNFFISTNILKKLQIINQFTNKLIHIRLVGSGFP